VIITLTTDFGTADGYVGAMKGVIATRAPTATMVDITHDIERHDIAAAAYTLTVASREFPADSIHVAVIDPGVGSSRAPVVVLASGQVFIGPDNGVFALVAPEPDRAFEIINPSFRAARVSATFHGRDVFAPAAAAIAAGLAPDKAGPEVELTGALLTESRTVVHVDRFGNLITDIPGNKLTVGGWVAVSGARVPVASTYADVAIGALLAYVGSANTVEVAVREGSAADRLKVGRGFPVAVRRFGDD